MKFRLRTNFTFGARASCWKHCAAVLSAGAAGILLLVTGGAAFAWAQVAQADPATNATTAHAFVDEIGRHVSVPSKINRIVSLAPNLTEIVFALKAENQLVGDTDFCDYPPQAAQKPRVGGPVNPNLEEIVKLRPDVILATSINRRETVNALDRLGLPVYITDPHSVNEMVASVERIGSVLGAEKSTESLVASLRARLTAIDSRLAQSTPRRVLFVVWTDPLISVGRGTFIADALRRAGALSVVETAAEWPRINLEEIIRLQPEYLVFAGAHAGDTHHDIDALRSRPGWRDLEALRGGKIIVINEAIIRPVPRIVDAVEQLARSLHPEDFNSHAEPSADSKPIVEEACACAR
jgi:iron complex transport system substrate-binding protein